MAMPPRPRILKPVDDKPPPPVKIKNDAERCIKIALDKFWWSRLKRIFESDGFTSVQQRCDADRGRPRLSDVTTGDWQKYLQAGSSRCFEQRCDTDAPQHEVELCAGQCEFVWNKLPEQVTGGSQGPMAFKRIPVLFLRYMGNGRTTDTTPVPPLLGSPAGRLRLGRW